MTDGMLDPFEDAKAIEHRVEQAGSNAERLAVRRMVPVMMRRRQNQPCPLQAAHRCGGPFLMRPLVDLVGREGREREGEREALTDERRNFFAVGRLAENEDGGHERHEREAVVSVDLEEAVARDRTRIDVVLAKRMDERAADQRRIVAKKCVAEPVDDAGDDVGCEISEKGSRAHQEQLRRLPRHGPEPRRERACNGHECGDRSYLEQADRQWSIGSHCALSKYGKPCGIASAAPTLRAKIKIPDST